jgi:hypothetical protein
MSEHEVKPGEGGRPWNCFYFPEDHQRAAIHVQKKAPEVLSWLREHAGLDDSDESDAINRVFWRTVREILPKATLVDHGKVMLNLRLKATPLSEEEKKRLEQVIEAINDRAANNPFK